MTDVRGRTSPWCSSLPHFLVYLLSVHQFTVIFDHRLLNDTFKKICMGAGQCGSTFRLSTISRSNSRHGRRIFHGAIFHAIIMPPSDLRVIW